MFRLHPRWLLGLLLLAACAPPAPDPVVTLNGVASGAPVKLGEVSAWDMEDGLRAQLSLVSSRSTVTCTRDGAADPCLRTTTGEDRVDLSWPRTKLGSEETTVVVLVDGVEAGRWVVSRSIVDLGLTVCAANTSAEDDGLPLDRCKALNPFGDLELPIDRTDAVLIKRARFSVRSGETTVKRISVVSHGDDEKGGLGGLLPFLKLMPVTAETPALLELDTRANVTVGSRALSWPAASATGRTVRDLDPTRAPVRVRIGSPVEISRSIQAIAEPATLIGFRDEAGILTLTSSLPAQLEPSAPTGLTVVMSPKAVGARSVWPRLTVRGSTGEWTDRIPFAIEGLAATDCRLEASDVNVGSAVVGETRIARLQVRNTGTGACTKLRVRPLPAGLGLESRPIPAPGAMAEWTLSFTPRTVGPQVVLLEADFDDSQPSFADLTVRVEATVTR
ncbi:MAG: hypothetical protein Q8N26_06500 [Myxococcales bacterium]|nr:hypothetical protein [Myxococcales bacterium]